MTRVSAPPIVTGNHWLLVLCLVGLDYFSTLAYLPSLAVAAAGNLAPLAACGVVFVTICLALPVYLYVVGRSPSGRGAAGLLEQVVPGWRGKILVLTLLGFMAADFVITRSLSVADAAVHVTHNPHGQAVLDHLSPAAERLATAWGLEDSPLLRSLLSREVLISLGLSVLMFGFWQLLQNGFTRKILWLAAVVIGVYLLLVSIVIVSGLRYLAEHPERCQSWWRDVQQMSPIGTLTLGKNPFVGAAALGILALWAFPQLALGLSGFELTMTVAPLVSGGARVNSTDSRSNIRNTRKLLVTAAALMSCLLLAAVFITTLLVPPESLAAGGRAEDRALAYLAHGGLLADGQPATEMNGWFGDFFGSVFDLSAIVVLSLAGASVVCGLGGLLPHYLHRLGMTVPWAGKTSMVMHLVNTIILVVTVVFRASLSAQQWAYATSVLVLLSGAALSAGMDMLRRRSGSPRRWLAVAPFALVCIFFLAMTALTAFRHASGVVIALSFVAAIVATSFVSRWVRSTEARFEGFSFVDETTRERWEAICLRQFQVLIPHRPGLSSLTEKSLAIQREYRLDETTPVLFVEVALGDPSEFFQRPFVQIVREGELEVVRVSKCVSVSHVLASLCLAMSHPDGRPPEVIFGWSNERPLAANLNFLLLGEGNVPWMVRELVRQAEPDPSRQPRIRIG